MLVLTRHPEEIIHMGDDITIHVLKVKGNQVHIGIDAPKHVSVHRQEIYERLQRERSQLAEDPGQ